MAKMWAGRTAGETAKIADDFNSSISFDQVMYKEDIEGSIVHAMMLAVQNIITEEEASTIIEGLESIRNDIESGELEIDMNAEDIHMFVEQVLTERIGATGKKLHTARSRNDQVALDLRLYLRKELDEIEDLIMDLLKVITDKAEANIDVIMPGYTHLQHAQPVLFAHHMMAYAMMFERDLSRLEDCRKRMNISPIGSCALAGTTYNTDRRMEARELGFASVCLNSMDGVSDRDYALEFVSSCATMMMHLSRFSEELILWSSSEFGFIEMSDAYSTGSSIMPQKKNPDMAELCRGKTGRVYGDMISLYTMLKGLPLAYNKDMQEDKEPVFDTVETVKMCLSVFTPMVETMTVNADAMYKAAQKGFMNATDLADYMTKKGIPFRDAYKMAGKIVHECIDLGCTLSEYPLEKYQAVSELIEEDVYEAIDLKTCVNKRTSYGGTSPGSVINQIDIIRELLN